MDKEILKEWCDENGVVMETEEGSSQGGLCKERTDESVSNFV